MQPGNNIYITVYNFKTPLQPLQIVNKKKALLLPLLHYKIFKIVLWVLVGETIVNDQPPPGGSSTHETSKAHQIPSKKRDGQTKGIRS